ncbi:MAG: hypothetical protein ACK5PP_11305, partial [Acidimicrobiales bacterium]
ARRDRERRMAGRSDVADLLPDGSTPGRGALGAPARAERCYRALVKAGVVYDHEKPPADGDHTHQPVRTPYEVLVAPRHGTCLDLALVFAAAAASADLDPHLLLTDNPAGGVHALILVRAGGDEPAPSGPEEAAERVRSGPTEPGDWMAVDVSVAAHDYGQAGREPVDWPDAVAAGYRIATGRAWVAVVPAAGSAGRHRPPDHPRLGVLDPAYSAEPVPPGGDRTDLEYRLALIRAEFGVVGFRRRWEYDDLLEVMRSSRPEDGVNVVLLHGDGGAGKTRLAAELAAVLGRDRSRPWQAGWLPGRLRSDRDGSAERLAWLARTRSPLLVGIDYAEGRIAEVETAITALAGRGDGPTWIVLTARRHGRWFDDLAETSQAAGRFFPWPVERRLRDPGALVDRAAAAFAATMAAGDPPPRSAPSGERWTTLDLVMIGWLAAHDPAAEAPTSRTDLYDQVLRHEHRLWSKIWADNNGNQPAEADVAGMRVAAAALSLAAPATIGPKRSFGWWGISAWSRGSCRTGGSGSVTSSGRRSGRGIPRWPSAPTRWPIT